MSVEHNLKPGNTRIITADAPASGYLWDHWSEDTDHITTGTSVNNPATITMPDHSVTLTANYSPILANVVYGALYNHYSAMGGTWVNGWHIPTSAEFTALRTYLGGNTIAGGKLKEAGLTYWNTPNIGADNSSGFNGRGGGYRISGANAGSNGKTTSAMICSDSNYYASFYNSSTVFDIANGWPLYGGISIRLIKDDSIDPGIVIIDGLAYSTISINGQVWLASNLKATHYSNGTVIPEVTNNTSWIGLTTGAWCAYANNHVNL